MGKIFSYADLKGKVKVGWVVKAVPEKRNACKELNGDGSNTQKITYVDGNGFRINGCWHPYSEISYVEVVSDAEKTLENLEPGDVLMVNQNGDEKTVIDVLPHSVLLSDSDRPEIADGLWSIKELREKGYTIKDQESDLTELTLDEVAKLANVPVEKLRIKD